MHSKGSVPKIFPLLVKVREIESDILSLSPQRMDLLTKPSFVLKGREKVLARGKGLVDGAVCGSIYSNLRSLLACETVHKKILFVGKLNNDILSHIKNIDGFVTLKEDPSSHAVIVANELGKPLILVSEVSRQFHEAEPVSLDGYSGTLYEGLKNIQNPNLESGELKTLLFDCANSSQLRIRINADNASEMISASGWPVGGFDSRTEHMLLSERALMEFRKLLFSGDVEGECKALKNVEEFMLAHLTGLYQAAGRADIAVRLLDPPLHEFLPEDKKILKKIAKELNWPLQRVLERQRDLKEANPMVGLRGVRLLITRPRILEMQIRSIFLAAGRVSLELKRNIVPSITIPMVVDVNEIRFVKNFIEKQMPYLKKITGLSGRYRLGVMIETPRAVAQCHLIGKWVEYASFGTNDLTAQIFAFSRGDVFEKFLGHYLDQKILDFNPFAKLDIGVMEQVASGVGALKRSNPKIQIDMCGEHASDPEAIRFCLTTGFHSISVSLNKFPKTVMYAAQNSLQFRRTS